MWQKWPASGCSVRKSIPNCRWLILHLLTVWHWTGSPMRTFLSGDFSTSVSSRDQSNEQQRQRSLGSNIPSDASASGLLYPSILPQSAYKYFSWHCAEGMLHTALSVSSGLTFEAHTFSHILHYSSMVRGGVALSSLVAALQSSLPTRHPSVFFIFRFVSISLCTIKEHPQTPFSWNQGLGTHHLRWRRFLFPLFYISLSLLSCVVLPLPAQVSPHPQPPYQASTLTPLVLWRSCSKNSWYVTK